MPQARALQSEVDVEETRGSSAIMRFFTGMLAFSAGVFICGACGSYTPTDPSFNSAVPSVLDEVTGLAAGPDNLFGHPGAMATCRT